MNNEHDLVKRLYQSLIIARNGRKYLNDDYFDRLMECIIGLITELSGLPLNDAEEIMKGAVNELRQKSRESMH
jgi:hypothetical protein